MPVTTRFTDSNRGFRTTGTGVLAGAELVKAKLALEADEAAVRGLAFAICDFSEVTQIELTSDDVKTIAEIDVRLSAWAPDVVVAVIAPRDAVYGMSRIWEVLAEPTGWPIGIFRRAVDAERWVQSTLARPAEKLVEERRS